MGEVPQLASVALNLRDAQNTHTSVSLAVCVSVAVGRGCRGVSASHVCNAHARHVQALAALTTHTHAHTHSLRTARELPVATHRQRSAVFTPLLPVGPARKRGQFRELAPSIVPQLSGAERGDVR